MKNISLFLSILLFAQTSFSQTVLFRNSEASFEKYQSLIAGSTDRMTPMDQLERRLEQEELPSFLQKELDLTLQLVAQNPESANEAFERLYEKLDIEPRSAAIRETMALLIDRMLPSANSESKKRLQKKLETLQIAPHENHDLRRQSTLVQKEIAEKIQIMKQFPGGQDFTVFWNGIRWTESLPIEADQVSQWIFISSQWKSRILTGTWSEVSAQIQNNFQDWVKGHCSEPRYQDILIVGAGQRETLFGSDCIANGETKKSEFDQPSLSQNGSQENSIKPWIWGALAIGLGLTILSLSGKKIQFQH